MTLAHYSLKLWPIASLLLYVFVCGFGALLGVFLGSF